MKYSKSCEPGRKPCEQKVLLDVCQMRTHTMGALFVGLSWDKTAVGGADEQALCVCVSGLH